MKNLPIHVKLLSIVVVFVVGFAVHSFIVHTTTPETYEASDYREVMGLKDLIADIAPPSMFVLEAQLVAVEMTRTMDPDEQRQMIEAWGKLQREFKTRHAYWSERLGSGELRTAVLEEVKRSAERVFSLGNDRLIPALRADDGAAAQIALNDMSKAYHEHQAAVLHALQLARSKTDASITDAAGTISSRKLGLLGLGLVIALMGAGIAAWIGSDIVRRSRAMADTLSRVAGGDLRARADSDAKDELGQMSAALNRALDAVESVLSDVRQVAVSLADSSGGLARSSEQLSRGAQQQAASLEETAASLEQITATIKQNATSVNDANQVAAGSHRVAERGGAVVSDAVKAMEGITIASRRIGDIITTIDEIALQTNLLALNAAVEAARAGEQGRGFAVVAAEVGNLAQRSASAAKEVKTLIKDSLERIESGHSLVGESGRALSDIIMAVKKVTEIVAQIASGSREQSLGVEQVNQAVAQMDQVTQTSAGQTDELAHTAAHLAQSASHLRSLLLRFQLRDGADSHAADSGGPMLRLSAPSDYHAANDSGVHGLHRTGSD